MRGIAIRAGIAVGVAIIAFAVLVVVLNATVRNRAGYPQAYPWLELSLTDTQDAAIARRVFLPAEYLPQRLSSSQPFAAASDIAVRLWIDAQGIGAAGYRLYVFYP